MTRWTQAVPGHLLRALRACVPGAVQPIHVRRLAEAKARWMQREEETEVGGPRGVGSFLSMFVVGRGFPFESATRKKGPFLPNDWRSGNFLDSI